jgi:hypothetical protein
MPTLCTLPVAKELARYKIEVRDATTHY